MENRHNPIMPIRLPKLTVHEARLGNLLLNKKARLSFALGQFGTCHCQLQPGDHSIRHACPISLALELGNTLAGLWLSAWPLAEAIDQFTPTKMLSTLPENLQISIVEHALSSLLGQVEQGIGMKVSVQSMSTAFDGLRNTHLSIGFQLDIQPTASDAQAYNGFGLALVDSQLYPYLQQRLRLWPAAANADWEQHVTSLRLELSRSTFSLQEINNLQPADLILLEDVRFLENNILRLRLDSGHYCEASIAKAQPTTLTVTSEWFPMEHTEEQQLVDNIAQIPVQLAFDLGEKTLPFSEVRQLHPGSVIELGKTLSEIVQIRSQHRLIGTGELVEINGRVGVRIISLFNRKAKGG